MSLTLLASIALLAVMAWILGRYADRVVKTQDDIRQLVQEDGVSNVDTRPDSHNVQVGHGKIAEIAASAG